MGLFGVAWPCHPLDSTERRQYRSWSETAHRVTNITRMASAPFDRFLRPFSSRPQDPLKASVVVMRVWLLYKETSKCRKRQPKCPDRLLDNSEACSLDECLDFDGNLHLEFCFLKHYI
ncbi:hypothetical protein IF2G_06585 [Cordyceps javanica]|nr:hypothetical protein IF2G_06585 [Cordyceps javanica]